MKGLPSLVDPARNVRPRLGERPVNLPPLVDPAALDLNVAIERAPPILDLAPAICPLTEYLLRGLPWSPLIRVRVEEDERFWTVALSGNTVAAVGAEYERRLRQSRCESGCPGQQGCDAGVRRRCRLWRDGERLDDRETLDASDLNDEPPKEENLDDTGRPPTLAVGFEQTGGADDGTSSEDEAPSAGAGAPAAGGSMEDPSSDSSGEDTPLEDEAPSGGAGAPAAGGSMEDPSSEDEAPSGRAGAPAAGGSMEDPSSDSSVWALLEHPTDEAGYVEHTGTAH